ncbi:unnamed protein product, partial [Iphiclides podalirius]
MSYPIPIVGDVHYLKYLVLQIDKIKYLREGRVALRAPLLYATIRRSRIRLRDLPLVLLMLPLPGAGGGGPLQHLVLVLGNLWAASTRPDRPGKLAVACMRLVARELWRTPTQRGVARSLRQRHCSTPRAPEMNCPFNQVVDLGRYFTIHTETSG